MASYAVFAAFAVILVAQAGANETANCTEVVANNNQSLVLFEEFKNSLDVDFTKTIQRYADRFKDGLSALTQSALEAIKNYRRILNKRCIKIANELPDILEESLNEVDYCVNVSKENFQTGGIEYAINLYEETMKNQQMNDCLHGTSDSKSTDKLARESLSNMSNERKNEATTCMKNARNEFYIDPLMTLIVDAGEQCEHTLLSASRFARRKEPRESTTLQPALEESSE